MGTPEALILKLEKTFRELATGGEVHGFTVEGRCSLAGHGTAHRLREHDAIGVFFDDGSVMFSTDTENVRVVVYRSSLRDLKIWKSGNVVVYNSDLQYKWSMYQVFATLVVDPVALITDRDRYMRERDDLQEELMIEKISKHVCDYALSSGSEEEVSDDLAKARMLWVETFTA